MTTTSSQLNVIALISGGKDSLFTILHCLASGHNVVALANLHPKPQRHFPHLRRDHAGGYGGGNKPESGADVKEVHADKDEDDDIDSYMYQTVGHSLIPLYARALDLPLYRQPIRGKAVDAGVTYVGGTSAATTIPATKGCPTNTAIKSSCAASLESSHGADPTSSATADVDEIDSLLELLERVKAAHPAASAVCAGAILSTYQRTRVEAVALKLGLVPLAFLWQYPVLPVRHSLSMAPAADDGAISRASQDDVSNDASLAGGFPRSAQLLADMAAVGMEARIVKVASGGLDESLLWANITDPATVARLERQMSRFGETENGALLGEGGEFETMALDGPFGVWKGRIEVESINVVTGEGGTAILKVRKGRVVNKVGRENEDAHTWTDRLRTPPLFDEDFSWLLRRVLRVDLDGARSIIREAAPHSSLSRQLEPSWTISSDHKLLTISNMTATALTSADPSTQLSSIFIHLKSLLATEYATDTSTILHCTMLLRSMSSFQTLNRVYSNSFPNPNPPARVTVACGDALPHGVDVSLNVVVDIAPFAGDTTERWRRKRALHVQSQSYWAPANIGPYSQAVAAPVQSKAASSMSDTTSADHLSQDAELIFMAGQIPLVPASMEMLDASHLEQELLKQNRAADMLDDIRLFPARSVLALQHLWRVGRNMGVRWWAGGLAFITAHDAEEAHQRALETLSTWTGIHEHRPGDAQAKGLQATIDALIDVWDLKNGIVPSGVREARAEQDADADGRAPLPDFSIVVEPEECRCPPCFVVQFDELPRGAEAEWTALGVKASRVCLSEFKQGELSVNETRMDGTLASVVYVGVPEPGDVAALWEVLGRLDGNGNATSGGGGVVEAQVTVYAAKDLPHEWRELMRAQVVPCRRVWGGDGRELAAGLVIRRTLIER